MLYAGSFRRFHDEQIWQHDLLAQINYLYAQWRLAKEEEEPLFEMENIRFEHHAGWNKSTFSIQSAHDLKTPIWKAAFVAVEFGAIVFPIAARVCFH